MGNEAAIRATGLTHRFADGRTALDDVSCYVVGHTAMRRAFQENPLLVERISHVLGSRQSALEGEREGLSTEAHTRRSADHKLRVLSRIRDFFHLG